MLLLRRVSKYSDAIIYVILTALSTVFIDKLDDMINPLLSLFLMALIATLWFNLINFKNLLNVYVKALKDRSYYLMSLAVGINWLSSIYAPNYSDPFVYIASYFCTIAICGFWAGFVATCKKSNLASIGLMLLAIFSIVLFYKIDEGRNLNYGIILGLLGGVSAYMYAHYSRKLSIQYSFSSSQVLGMRFILLCIFLFITLQHLQIKIVLSRADMINILIMSVLSLIIPVFFYQQAIRKIGVAGSSTTVAFTPVVVFIIYSIAYLEFNWINCFVSLIVIISLLAPKLLLKGKV